MLNGASLNARRFNIGVRPEPTLFSGDAVGEYVVETDFVRTRHFEVEAPVVATADVLLSAQRFLSGDLYTTSLPELDASAIRVGSGYALAELDGSLYYTRVIYWNGAAEIQLIAVSDVGVVYGEGSAVMVHAVEFDGARAKYGFGDAIAITDGDFAASAIRRGATMSDSGISELFAQLDSAHITGGGIRYIDGFGDAYAYLDVEDAGMKRQVFIGGADMFIVATGSGSAVRHWTGAADINAMADVERTCT